MFDFEETTSTADEGPQSPPPAWIRFGEATHRGRVRRVNEDDHASAPSLGFFVVADGVGGSRGGAMAARLTTIGMVYALRSTRTGTSEAAADGGANVADAPRSATPRSALETHGPELVAAVHQTHKLVCDHAMRCGCPGAATTMAAIWVAGERALVANTGDSRVYRLTGAGLEQLTKDHTALQEHIDEIGPPAEPLASALENVVTQVVGGRTARIPTVHLRELPIERREVLLLCTDGLFKMLSEAEIASVLASSASPEEAARDLVARANDAGGLDNITAVVVEVNAPPSGR